MDYNTPLQDSIKACETWEELQELVTLDEAKQICAAHERQRVYRQQRNQKESAKNAVLKARYNEDAKFQAEVDAEIARRNK